MCKAGRRRQRLVGVQVVVAPEHMHWGGQDRECLAAEVSTCQGG